MTVTHSGPALPCVCYDSENNIVIQSSSNGDFNTNMRLQTLACSVWYIGGGTVRFDLTKDCYIDGALKLSGTSYTSTYLYNSGHVSEVVPVWD